MNTNDDRDRQQGAADVRQQSGQGQQQARQQPQQGGHVQQGGPTSVEGPRAGAGQANAQQEQYSRNAEQTATPARRGGGAMPTLFGSGRGSPFELLRRLDDDMDRLFHQLWGGTRSPARRGGGDPPSMWMPQVEMCERDGKLHIYADLPGMTRENVEVRLEADQLILQGERRSGHDEPQEGGYFHTERSYGSFCRSIPLPEGVDPATAQASFRDGVLDVCFDAPRAPQKQGRRIDIRDEPGGAAERGSRS